MQSVLDKLNRGSLRRKASKLPYFNGYFCAALVDVIRQEISESKFLNPEGGNPSPEAIIGTLTAMFAHEFLDQYREAKDNSQHYHDSTESKALRLAIARHEQDRIQKKGVFTEPTKEEKAAQGFAEDWSVLP